MYYDTYLLSSIVTQDYVKRSLSASNRPLNTRKRAQSAGRGRYPAGCSDVWDLSLYTKNPRVTHISYSFHRSH